MSMPNYWNRILPRSLSSRWRRFVFGVLSVLVIALDCQASRPLFGQSGSGESLTRVTRRNGDAEPSRGDPETLLQFRRVFVPNQRQGDVTSGYLPLRREKFDDLLESVRRKQSAEQSQVHLVRTRYFAVLEQETLRGGFAEMDFHNPSATPRASFLQPLGIAVGSPVWELPNRTPAELGSDEEGHAWVLVPQSGRLFLPWSLRGEKDEHGTVSFRLRLPACPQNQLILALPRQVIPSIDEGMATRWAGERTHWAGIPEAEPFLEVDPEQFDFWQLDLGGNTETTLHISSSEREEPALPFVTLRQSDRYTCYASRVEWQAELTVDVYRAATEGLVVRLDDHVSLLDARLGEESIPWIVDEIDNDHRKRYQLQFPRALQGPGHAIRLTIHSPLIVDQPWELPRLKCEGVFWQEGRAELIFPDGLELERLVPQACAQTQVNALPQGATSFSFQCYRPDYSLGVTWRHREPRVAVDLGTSIRMDTELISGEVIADLRGTWGESFTVRARIPRPWEIDRVEVEPSSALASTSGAWRLEKGVLEIPLREPITSEQPLRVRVEGHRAAPPETRGLRVDQLEFLQLLDVARPTSIIRVHPASPLQVKLTDDMDVPRIDPSGLTPEQRERLGEGTEGIFFRREQAPSTLTATIAQEVPSFVADIRCEAILEAAQLTEAYVVRCIPESLPVRRVRVQLSQSRETPVVWRLSGHDDPLSATLVTQSYPSARGEMGGESWEIELPRSQSSMFELQGERSLTISEATSIGLASLPQATSETGRVTVRSREPVEITSHGLEPLPIEPSRADQYPLVRGSFRYQPSHTDQLIIGEDQDSPWPEAWVWAAHHTSRLVGEDRVIHEVLFRLENAGAESVEALLPPGIDSLIVHVDQRRMPETADQRQVTLPLPLSRRFPTVRIQFQTSASHAFGSTHLQVPLPRLDVPTLRARWNVLTSSDDRVSAVSEAMLLTPPEVSSIRRRLLGPLARPTSETGTRETGDGQRKKRLGGRGTTPRSGQSSWREWAGDLRWNWGAATSEASSGGGDSRLEEISDWHELVLAIESRIRSVPGREQDQLRVDRHALALAGISPTAVLHPGRASGSASRLGELFVEHDLLLIEAGNVWALTTRQMESIYRDNWSEGGRPTGVLGAVPIHSSGWFSQLLHEEDQGVCGFPTVSAWLEWHHHLSLLPAPGGLVDWAVPTMRRGWRVHAFNLGSGNENLVEVVVTRGNFVRQGAWVTFFFVVAGGIWLSRSARRWLVPYLILLTLFALVVPELYIAWGAAGFWGAVLSWCFAVVQPIRLPEMLSHRDFSSTRWRLGWSVALWGAVWLVIPAAAQEHGEGSLLKTNRHEGEFRVLIPVDEEKKTVGAYVYVPRTFYDFVYRYLDREDAPYEWLLRRATYTAQFGSGETAEGAAISSLTASYQFDTFQPHQWIRLPLKRRELQLLDVKLNGQPAEVRWSSDEDELLVMAVQPRQHELSLTLRIRRVELGNALNFAVPSVPNSTLIVRNLPTTMRLEPVGALGATHSRNGRLEVQLGPVSRVTLRRADTRVRTDAAMVESDEFAWMRVRPGATVLDVRLQIASHGGRLETLTLLADSRLRLLPIGSGQAVEGEPEVVEGDYQQIRFRLRETVGPRFNLQLSFLLTNSSGVGQLRLPRWEVMGVTRKQRQFAVSHAPTIEIHDAETSALQELEIDQFLADWGRDVEVPRHAYLFPSGESIGDQDWQAESRFLPSETSVNQQTRIRVTQDAIHLAWDALLTTSGSPAFQRRLRVPPGFEIDELVIVEGDAEQTPRYRLNGDGELALFLSGSADSRQRVLLKGQVRLSGQTVTPLPLVHLLGADQEANLLELYRDSDIETVSLQHVDAWIPQTPADTDSPARSDEFWIGTWSQPAQDSATESPTLVLRPNRRKGEGHLVTRLMRSSEGWRVEAEYHLHVEQGVYDMVRLELPSDWLPPVELEPAHPFELRPLPGENRQQLIIRPANPVCERFTVRIRGNWAATGDRIRRVPDIIPLDVEQTRRYLVVPTRLEAQQISWATSGLQAGPLPDLFQLAREMTDAWEAYHVLGPRFHANIRHVERVAGFPQIRLADIQVRWQPTGFQGIAMFDIEPAGRESCLLVVPPGIELLVASVDGVPGRLEPLGEGRWRVALGPRQLPQRLELLFRGDLDERVRGMTELRVPFCEDFPVARTLWTIRAPASRRFSWKDSGDSRVGDIRQEIVRLESMSALVDLAHDAATELAAEDAENWWKTWSSRIDVSRARIRRFALDQPARAGSGEEERLQAMEDAWRGESRRFGKIPISRLLNDDPREVWDPAVVWDEATRGLHRDIRFMFPGTADSLTLQPATPWTSSVASRTWTALLLVVGWGIVWWRPPRTLLQMAGEYPHLILMALGVASLVWLVTPWIGVAFMMLAFLSSWRPPWPAANP